MNAVGLFLEESEEKDYLGLLSFVALSYILVPFQAYASVKGFIEKEEGPWFRTPKTGKITDIFTRGKFYRWLTGIIPGRRPAAAPAAVSASISSLISANPYVALATANSQFNNFSIKPKRLRWVSKAALVILLILSSTLLSLTRGVPEVFATNPATTQYMTKTTTATLTNARKLQTTFGTQDTSTSMDFKRNTIGSFKYWPGTLRSSLGTSETKCGTPDGHGWILDTPFGDTGSIAAGTWTFDIYESDTDTLVVGHLDVCVFKITVSGGSIQTSSLLFESEGNGGWSTGDSWDGTGGIVTRTATGIGIKSLTTNEYLYIEYWNTITGAVNSYPVTSLYTDECGATDPSVQTPTITIPEKLTILIMASPFVIGVVYWMKKRRESLWG